MRYFNAAGLPCLPERHYLLPPEQRLPQARGLIEEARYFVVHAPRQTGKTTTLATLARALTAEGAYVALRLSCEVGEHMGDDYQAVERALLDRLSGEARFALLPAELAPPDPWPQAAPGVSL